MEKTLFKYTNKTDLLKITIALKMLFAEVTEINSNFSSATLHSKVITEEITSSILMLEDDIKAYRSVLRRFANNYDYLNDTSCIDKFLNGEIIEVRAKAISSLKVLGLKYKCCKTEPDKTNLGRVIIDLRNSVNEYLSIIRETLRTNRKLQTILLSRNINYVDKYNLEDI